MVHLEAENGKEQIYFHRDNTLTECVICVKKCELEQMITNFLICMAVIPWLWLLHSLHSGQTVVYIVYTTGGAFDLYSSHSTECMIRGCLWAAMYAACTAKH